jgi:hypothetical protein
MFETTDDHRDYIVANYPEVTDRRIDQSHWDLLCTTCKIVRGFQVLRRDIGISKTSYGRIGETDFYAPHTYYFRCPVCRTFKQWIVFNVQLKDAEEKYRDHYFRVTSIPSEGLEQIAELPENPPALRKAYREAIRSMDANAHMAAAAMFRRALQVITRNILGAKPSTLANELTEVVGKTYNGATIRNNFANVGYIIKDAANQAAHPDRDPDLMDFTPQDAEDLQKIFMELVSELFIIPEVTKKARADFLARRKITPKS